MANQNFVPEGAIVVRLIANGREIYASIGYIFKTCNESDCGQAFYRPNWGICDGDWRYATALELYCFKKYNITNIEQIDEQHKKHFNNLIKNKEHGTKENELPRNETIRPNSTRPRAIGIRQCTKQVAIGSRPIGNETKGKCVKTRVTSITLKNDPIKF